VTEVPSYSEQEYAERLAEELALLRARREARRLLDAEERPPASLPEILTLRERLQRPREPVTYRIEGWQPAGSRLVLVAQFKAGKTTLVGNLARVLVDGGLFLGRDQAHPVGGTVALVDVEMSAAQFDTWLASQKIVHDDRVVVVPLRGAAGAFDILTPDRRTEWAALLRERQVSYLVLDCLRPVLDALGLDEHHDAGQFLTAFDTLMAEASIAEACIVHHMGHYAERSRGDSRIRDWPDVEWRLVRQDEEPASPRYIAAYGRDVEQPESQLHYDPTTRRLTVAGGNRRDAGARDALDAVVVLLRAAPGQSGNQIEAALAGAHPRAAVREALAVGVQTGQLARQPGSRTAIVYFVVESSQRDNGMVTKGSPEIHRRSPLANSFPQATESARRPVDLPQVHNGQSMNVHGEVVLPGHGFSSPARREFAGEVPPLRRDYKERRGGGEVKGEEESGEVKKSEPEPAEASPPAANSAPPPGFAPTPLDLTPEQARMLALLRGGGVPSTDPTTPVPTRANGHRWPDAEQGTAA
jgi:hypothetical protein